MFMPSATGHEHIVVEELPQTAAPIAAVFNAYQSRPAKGSLLFGE
jgi:hypothetical protein